MVRLEESPETGKPSEDAERKRPERRNQNVNQIKFSGKINKNQHKRPSGNTKD